MFGERDDRVLSRVRDEMYSRMETSANRVVLFLQNQGIHCVSFRSHVVYKMESLVCKEIAAQENQPLVKRSV